VIGTPTAAKALGVLASIVTGSFGRTAWCRRRALDANRGRIRAIPSIGKLITTAAIPADAGAVPPQPSGWQQVEADAGDLQSFRSAKAGPVRV